MEHHELRRRFATLTTPHLADACIRAQIPVRCAPTHLRPVVPGGRLAGRALPTRHTGSVDIFLEALEHGAHGDVLVVDNGGRLDESCVGDLVVQEAHTAGLTGIVIWGLHRDTADIQTIGLPVFSLGPIPTGPQRLDMRLPDALDSATVATGRYAATTWSSATTTVCSSYQPPKPTTCSHSLKRSATPNDARPNRYALVSLYASR